MKEKIINSCGKTFYEDFPTYLHQSHVNNMIDYIIKVCLKIKEFSVIGDGETSRDVYNVAYTL